MKKLFSYLKDYRKESILGPLFKLLEAFFELIVPLVVAAIIDTGIGQGNRGYIVRMCLVLVALGLIGLLCSVTAQYFAAKASVGFTKKLRHALFAHIQGFSYQTLDTVGTSTIITRMTSDMNQVQTGLNLALRLLLRSPFVVFGAMIMAFTVDSRAALWFAAAIPVLSVVVFGIMLVSMPLYKKVQQLLDKVLGITRENLTGVRVIRAFGKEAQETADFTRKNEEFTAAQKHVGRISALMNPVTYVIINLAIVAVVWTGGCQVDGSVANSVLFHSVTVEEGAKVEYSILMPGTVVKAGASISYAIVAEDAVVEAGAVVGAPPDDSPGWGIAVVAGGVTVGEKATVTPSAMVREDVKGGERV